MVPPLRQRLGAAVTARKECGPRIIWTEENLAELRRRFAAGETDATIAGALRGTRSAVQVQRSKLGLVREAVSAVAATRRRHLDAVREARKRDAAVAARDVEAPGIDDDDVPGFCPVAASMEMGRRIEATGQRFRDVRFRRVA